MAKRKAKALPRIDFLKQIHEVRRKLDERAFYPPHDKRRESEPYKTIHHQLVVEEDRPCLVCGVRNSTLKDKTQNRYGARQMETHHHVIEWALANAIDTKKFNDRVVAGLRRRHGGEQKYGHDFTDEEVKAWIDRDRDNLWVLCDVHHRHKWLGIHAISGPIWGPQDLLKAEFEETVAKKLRNGSGTGKQR